MVDDITLRQALNNFHWEYREHLSHEKENLSEDALAFFQAHDAAHVIFGCDISLYGEGAVKIWTLFGTNLGFKNHIKGYRAVNALGLSKNFTARDVVLYLFKLLYAIPLLLIRTRRMNKLWPWNGWERYLDQPVAEIRKEYNIKVLR